MMNLPCRLLLPIAALLGAVSITKAAYQWPELFPDMLKSFGNALVETMGATSAESNSNIELAYIFIVSLLLVLAVFTILRVMWACFRNHKIRRQD